MNETVKTKIANSFLSLSDVMEITSLSATTIWREENAGRFPKRRKLSSNRVGFIQSEIDDWCYSKTLSS